MVKHILNSGLLVCILFTGILNADTWKKYSANPVLDFGAPGKWDSRELDSPAVIMDHDTLKMWYAGWDGDTLTFKSIGYAYSMDMGKTWARPLDKPVLEAGKPGSWDDTGVFTPFVLKNGKEYWMYFAGLDTLGHYRIGLAISSDGVKWEKYIENPIFNLGSRESWDYDQVFSPSIVTVGGTFHLCYAGMGDPLTWALGHATSDDGIHWTKDPQNPVIEPGAYKQWDSFAVSLLCLKRVDKVFKMWYSGSEGNHLQIGYATSKDGTQWIKSAENPVLKIGDPGSWDEKDVLAPAVIIYRDGDFTRASMFYCGVNDYYYTFARIGLATCDDMGIKEEFSHEQAPTGKEITKSSGLNMALKCYPNPFNPETSIVFHIPEPGGYTSIKIYNTSGQKVKTLLEKNIEPGDHSEKWNGDNQAGQKVSSGVYYCRIEHNALADMIRLIIIK